MGTHHTLGVSPSRERVDQIRVRAEALVMERTPVRFRELVLVWAQSDAGTFPCVEQARDEAREELEVLCGALGEWAALAPHEVFPVGLVSRTRPTPPDEWWW